MAPKRKLDTALPDADHGHAAGPGYWLLKSEPDDYSIDQMKADGMAPWDGVRSKLARANMRRMKLGDLALFYHSSAGPSKTGVVGTVIVAREAYPDPADAEWVCVDVRFESKLDEPLLLRDLKCIREVDGAPSPIADMVLFRQARLSVQPVSPESYRFLVDGRARTAITVCDHHGRRRVEP